MLTARSTLSRSQRASSGLLLQVERRLGLTLMGCTVAGLVAIGFLAARRLASAGLYLFVYGLGFVFVTAFLLGRRRLGVDARRSELPLRMREGQTVEVAVAVTARRRLATIVLQEEMDSHLGNAVRIPIAVLPSGEELVHSYRFTPRLRGVYAVGPLTAVWTDPFGFTRKRAVLVEPVEIIVHPTVEAVQDRVLSRAWEDPPIRPPVSKAWPTGFEFYGMQDYQPGDDPRRIVWRATARTLDAESGSGRYLVRVAEQGITDSVSVIFDTDKEWHSPGDPSETFELGVRAVASVGAGHLKDGFAVTIDTNERRIADALRGAGKRTALLDELARAEPCDVRLTAVLERYLLDRSRDTHLVVVTPYLDPVAATRIRVLKDRGVSILLALLNWEDTEPGSLHRAGALGCNVIEVAAGMPLSVVFQRVHGVGGRR